MEDCGTNRKAGQNPPMVVAPIEEEETYHELCFVICILFYFINCICCLKYRKYSFSSAYRGRVAQWLRRCATNRKVAGSVPDGVIGIFH